MSALAIHPSVEEIRGWLDGVPDPEIPVISITDLGIVRGIRWDEESDPPRIVVTITPTYSGCPATEVIAESILDALREHGIEHAVLETSLSPPWTTDWLSSSACEKLRAYGITPPSERPQRNHGEQAIDISRLTRRALAAQGSAPIVPCPRCSSRHTQVISPFGSTPCKALYRCLDCLEPFDYFKRH